MLMQASNINVIRNYVKKLNKITYYSLRVIKFVIILSMQPNNAIICNYSFFCKNLMDNIIIIRCGEFRGRLLSKTIVSIIFSFLWKMCLDDTWNNILYICTKYRKTVFEASRMKVAHLYETLYDLVYVCIKGRWPRGTAYPISKIHFYFSRHIEPIWKVRFSPRPDSR